MLYSQAPKLDVLGKFGKPDSEIVMEATRQMFTWHSA